MNESAVEFRGIDMARYIVSILAILFMATVPTPSRADVPCAPVFFFGSIDASVAAQSGGESCADEVGIDWHPGHYIMSVGLRDGSATIAWNKISGSALAAPYFEGATLYLPWGYIETDLNTFNWDYLDGHLADAESVGKKLVIGLHPLTFNGPADRRLGCPADLEAMGYCFFQDGNNPQHCSPAAPHLSTRHAPKYWESNRVALERLKAFYVQLGERYNDDPRVAGVYMEGETSLGLCIKFREDYVPEFNINAYIAARLELMEAARAAFPNKVVLHGINGSERGETDMIQYYAGQVEHSIGTTQPDFGSSTPGFLNPNMEQWDSHLNRIPLGTEMQRATQNCTFPDANCRFGEPDTNYLRAMRPEDGGIHGLNFLFWPTHWEDHHVWDFDDEVAPIVKARMDAGDTLNMSCPSSFAALGGCNTP